jgi:hypothetical protein
MIESDDRRFLLVSQFKHHGMDDVIFDPNGQVVVMSSNHQFEAKSMISGSCMSVKSKENF